MKSNRAYDIILFGATGFTGKLTADYLAKKNGTFRWAIAGRSAGKLNAIKAELGLGDEVGVIVADSADVESLTAMTAQGRVVASTVGPYAKYGKPLVQACISTQTDYCDITGEPQFVADLLASYHTLARQAQIRIVNCCGFDSIPHDLGVYMLAMAAPDDEPLHLRGFVSASGTFSGGTWQSAIDAMGNLGASGITPRVAKQIVGENRKVRGDKKGVYKEAAVNGWVAPLPTIDPQIVLRSARMLPEYGTDFQYGHFVRIGKLSTLAVAGIGLGGVVAAAQFKPTRNLLKKVRGSGEGPSAEKRAQSKFRVTFVGTAGSRPVRGEVRGGDPGYDETSKMLSESALALAFDQLPERYGILTPAAAMGDALLKRLRENGMVFEIL
jgi:short subunit dehydrogenase-like uncharacterized protein